VHISQQLF